MFAGKPKEIGFKIIGDPGETASRVVSRDRYLRANRLATATVTAVFLMGLTACAQSKNPEAPIEGRLEYNGTIAHQVLVIENGKKVDCAVAAANGVSLTCDWAGAH